MSFEFERPSWMVDEPGHGNGEIVAEAGVHQVDGDNEYWKCFQRIKGDDGEYKVRTAVYDERNGGAGFSREGDFNLPAKYMGSLIEEARKKDIFSP